MNSKARLDAQPSSEEPSDRANAPPANAASVPRRASLLRFAGSWLGFSGLYAATGGACPFCGQPTCPTGFLSAGIVGGILALGLQAWRRLQK